MDRKQALVIPSEEARPPSSNVSVDSHNDRDAVEELPPAYTANGALRASTTATAQLTFRDFPPVDYTSYRPPASTISSDQTTITTSHKPFNKSNSALIGFIRQQAALPPRPSIRIKGISNTGTDFDIKVNLLPYLWRSTDPWNYLSIKPSLDNEEGQPRRSSIRRTPSSNKSLEAWVKEYCADQSSIKSFTLQRELVNLDLDTLSGLIRNTFADMGYRGRLDVKLETAFAKVVIDNQATGGAGAFFRPLVSAFIGAKNFEVVKAVWPFARSGPEEDQSANAAREFASISESAWWKEWKIAVARAAIESRKGWVTTEDKLEVVMSGWLQDAQIKPWGSHEAAYDRYAN